MKRTPMKRTAFVRAASTAQKSEKNRDLALEERAQRAINNAANSVASKSRSNKPLALVDKAVAAINNVAHAPIPKSTPARSERYRRVVAALPCACCGIAGYSQHAHENDGKGMGMKVDDRRSMPLCCQRPGIEGCHAAFDQYRLLPGGREEHRQAGARWAAETRDTITKLGLWPENLPAWQEGDDDV